MRRRPGFLLGLAALLALAVPAAEPAVRPARFLLAVTTGGSVALYQSSDGVRFAATPGFAPVPARSPALVRRAGTVYLFDTAALSAGGLGGPLLRFAVRPGGALAGSAPAAYGVQLASPEDAARASPGGIAPSVAVDDAGLLVLLYALRFEPATNACPLVGRSAAGQSPTARKGGAGQACVKLRTATEVAGSNGTAFTGDPGNRIVLNLDPADAVGPPALFRADKGWAVVLPGPTGCLRVLTAANPHGSYGNLGCIADGGPASPSGLWDARLREYRLYGVTDGRVVRAVTARLRRLAPGRFRPLVLPVRPSAARVAANAP
jgi:hypothetical protein